MLIFLGIAVSVLGVIGIFSVLAHLSNLQKIDQKQFEADADVVEWLKKYDNKAQTISLDENGLVWIDKFNKGEETNENN